MKFAGSHLPINTIDVAVLRKYEAHERKRGMAQNTINTTFKWLRTIITHACSEGVMKENPFDNFTIPKYVQSDRTFLEKHDRDEWVKVALAYHLGKTEQWITRLLEQNKNNGLLTTAEAIKVIRQETGLKESEILAEEEILEVSK